VPLFSRRSRQPRSMPIINPAAKPAPSSNVGLEITILAAEYQARDTYTSNARNSAIAAFVCDHAGGGARGSSASVRASTLPIVDAISGACTVNRRVRIPSPVIHRLFAAQWSPAPFDCDREGIVCRASVVSMQERNPT